MASFLSGEIDLYGFLENIDRMPQQKAFVQASEPHVAYVGGVGSGKSVVLCGAALLNAYAEPDGFSLIGRLNMPALESTTMKTFMEMCPEHLGEYYESKKLFKMANGHEIIFKHLDMSDPKVASHIRSMNLSSAYVDEATEVSEEVYFTLLGRLRRKTANLHRIRLASNPAGHDWVWRNFFDPDRKKALLESNRGITASTMDNPFLPPEYLQNMLNTYPEDWAERFIHGSFSDFSDLVYKEFTEGTHTWNPEIGHKFFESNGNPPKKWPVIIGIDIGSDIDPWAVDISAVAPNGMLFQFGEVYGNSMLIANIAAQIKMHIGERKVLGVAYDYSNRQCALELAEHNINGTPAMKEVEPGLFKMAQYMHIDPRIVHPFTGEQGSPRVFISQACKHAIHEHSSYKWAKNRSGIATGEPSHEYSHSPDSKRYAVHTFRPLPEKLKVAKNWENPDLDEASRQYWRDVEKYKDPMERFKPEMAVQGGQKTLQEWEKMAIRPPKRFVRPASAQFRRI